MLQKFRNANIFLVLIVLCILTLMVFPVPTWVMDLFLTANIALAITLLLLSLNISEPLRFATFPTFLLLATLFRLGLNIATTRLILLQADAGSVIDAFGRFVVAGNVVVGAVVFLILTIVQFVVIAKGSERVAEVAARFTLDAMPGRQMSIDAELRAGHIGHEEARSQRAQLARESQLYGSMDGAMKFVKGDAIAGLIITVINIIGGLGVGMLQLGMSGGEAVDTYSVLTVGDGLVSQIPALLVSVSAGFVITRVASEEKGRGLGQDMGLQLVQNAQVLLWVGVILLVFGWVPGMPLVPFTLLGGLVAFTGWRLAKRQASSIEAGQGGAAPGGDGPDPQSSVGGRGSEPESWGAQVPLWIELGTDLQAMADPSGTVGRRLREELARLRSESWWKSGVMPPPVTVTVNATLPPEGYLIRIWELPAGHGRLPVGHGRLLSDAVMVPGAVTEDAPGEPVDWTMADARRWVDAQDEAARNVGAVAAWDMPLEHLRLELPKRLHELMTMDLAQNLVRALRRTSPALVEECMPHPVSLGLLTEVLTRLLEEQVSIRPLGKILLSLSRNVLRDPDPGVLAENVRLDLRRELAGELCATGVLPVFLVSGTVEEDLRMGITRTETGTWLHLDPEIVEQMQERARELAARSQPGVRLVLVSSVETRRYLRKLIGGAVPDAVVLSYPELEGLSMVQPVGEF
ncbi:flagellar biosynthesis protein FlhA [Myxococcota bacterium]|nr:flagellar biosynthesis protein FlhA [Myxococcota bacterium]